MGKAAALSSPAEGAEGRLGGSLVDGRTAMDPVQALTGADDAANTNEPDQPASNATTRPGPAQTRPAPAP